MNTRRLAGFLLVSLTVSACGLGTGESPAATDRETVEQESARPQAASCVGREQSLGWDGAPTLVRRLGDAWMAPDEATRLAVLEEIWADDGVYVNAFDEELVVGRQAVAEYMAFGLADTYLEITDWKPIYFHNDRVQIPWRDCCPSGSILLTGTEYGEIDSAGRFSRVTSFWDHAIVEVAAEACG
jgi:hypothetical protein